MAPRKTPEQELAAAEQQLAEARRRLGEVHTEQRGLARQRDQAEAEIQNLLYTAAASGSRADVTEQRTAAAAIAQQFDDLTPVERALGDGVAPAERARDELMRQLYPELEEALERRAAELVEAGNDLAERHARERAAQTAAEREIEQEWGRLMAALPAPFRGRFDRRSLTVEPSPTMPDPGLAIYVD